MSTFKPSASTGSESIGADQNSFESPLDAGTSRPGTSDSDRDNAPSDVPSDSAGGTGENPAGSDSHSGVKTRPGTGEAGREAGESAG